MKIKYLFGTVLGLVILNSGCKEKDDPVIEDKSQITVEITHQINNRAIVFDTIDYQNSLNESFSAVTLKHFMSGFYLHNDQGDSVALKNIHYIDGKEEATHSFTATDIPYANYNKLSFYVGIDDSRNLDNMFVNPPESFMVWPAPMGGGYHYMKFEGKFISSTQDINNFQMHTGPTMGNDYSIRYDIPITFNVDKATGSIELVLNMDKYMESPNELSLEDITMIMGNMQMQVKLQANGVNVVTLGEIK
jgi:hypothetical protein